jgi:hypothetical protein
VSNTGSEDDSRDQMSQLGINDGFNHLGKNCGQIDLAYTLQILNLVA